MCSSSSLQRTLLCFGSWFGFCDIGYGIYNRWIYTPYTVWPEIRTIKSRLHHLNADRDVFKRPSTARSAEQLTIQVHHQTIKLLCSVTVQVSLHIVSVFESDSLSCFSFWTFLGSYDTKTSPRSVCPAGVHLQIACHGSTRPQDTH